MKIKLKTTSGKTLWELPGATGTPGTAECSVPPPALKVQGAELMVAPSLQQSTSSSSQQHILDATLSHGPGILPRAWARGQCVWCGVTHWLAAASLPGEGGPELGRQDGGVN